MNEPAKKLLSCAGCGQRLIKQLGNSRTFEFEKRVGNNPITGKEKVRLSYSGSLKITCSNCGQDITFSNHAIQKSMTYVVVPATG